VSTKRDAATVAGIGAAACAACCAGPIVGFLAATGVTIAAGVALFGLIGLVLATAVASALVLRRRRRRSCQAVAPADIVPVAAPVVRSKV
jgi:hypothetical protein